jgi:hypothetical protein
MPDGVLDNIRRIDWGGVSSDMYAAAAGVGVEGWDEVRGVVKTELRALSLHIKEIAKGYAKGKMKKRTARTLVKMAKNNLIALLATTTTLVLMTVEKMINAALGVIRDIVNTAMGFALI